MIEDMTGGNEKMQVSAYDGAEDGRKGTNSLAILKVIQNNKDAKRIFIIADIGSAILLNGTAIDLLEDHELK